MAALPNPYQQYQNNSVMSAEPGQLTLMLYNGAVKFIKQCILSLENKDLAKAHTFNVKAQDIYLYLKSTLNDQYEISKNLDSLYDYLYNRLVEANIKKDKAILEEVLGMTIEFRDTWSQALKMKK